MKHSKEMVIFIEQIRATHPEADTTVTAGKIQVDDSDGDLSGPQLSQYDAWKIAGAHG